MVEISREKFCTPAEARQLTGYGISALKRMRKRLGGIRSGGRVFYDREKVTDVMRAVSEMEEQMRKMSQTHFTPPQAAKALRTSVQSVRELYWRDVLPGLIVAHPKTSGALFIEKEGVLKRKKQTDEALARIRGLKKTHLTTEQAARVLKLSRWTASQLFNLGFVSGELVKHPRYTPGIIFMKKSDVVSHLAVLRRVGEGIKRLQASHYTIDEAAQKLGLKRHQVKYLYRKRVLPGIAVEHPVNPKGIVFIPREAVLNYKEILVRKSLKP